MLLRDSLRVQPGDALAFVGAGGKSSAIARLVGELQAATPVLVSTTTRLARAQSSLASAHLTTLEPSWGVDLKARLESGESVLLTAGLNQDEKWTSPAGDDLQRAFETVREASGVMLVEADGARGRSLKAPAAHEPAMPSFAKQVVLLCALDAVGASLSEGSVHRPELAGPILGLEPGQEITVGAIIRLLGDARAGLKSIEAGVTLRCLANKVSTPSDLAHGRELAAGLLLGAEFQSVLLAELQAPDPVKEVHCRIAGVILAAGGSERFGRQKLLEHWGGEALIRHAVRAAVRSGLDQVVVVVGAEREEVERALTDMPVRIVVNEAWREGQAGSLRLALGTLPEQVEGAVFLLGDMPLIEPELVKALILEHRRTLGPIIAPTASGRRGNPVLFDRTTFRALAEIRGDRGGRAIFDRFQVHEIPWDDTASKDVDTLDDLRQLTS
jgi:molybdenum cofactor cytidylyltransferase